jgi:hypothetical protein
LAIVVVVILQDVAASSRGCAGAGGIVAAVDVEK